jgi:hypothetical protein
VNITDVDPIEAPEEVYWVDPIHKNPRQVVYNCFRPAV